MLTSPSTTFLIFRSHSKAFSNFFSLIIWHNAPESTNHLSNLLSQWMLQTSLSLSNFLFYSLGFVHWSSRVLYLGMIRSPHSKQPWDFWIQAFHRLPPRLESAHIRNITSYNNVFTFTCYIAKVMQFVILLVGLTLPSLFHTCTSDHAQNDTWKSFTWLLG